MQSDSIEGIYNTLSQCAKISQFAGGIGLSIHNIRATGSYIRGTNGVSNGIVPMLRNFDMTARYVDQGEGKRKGSFAICLEPWHADIFDFLNLKKNHGKEELKARDLFYGLWSPDLFMKRVEEDSIWSLFRPNEALGLADCYGATFEEKYKRYEKEDKERTSIKAQKLWFAILESQFETIYFAALTVSKDLAQKEGVYESYLGSPISQGILQFDMWGEKLSIGRWNWDDLRKKIVKYSIRNALLVVPIPLTTAFTSQNFGHNKCFEPYTANIYTRRVLSSLSPSGEFIVVNKYLLEDLIYLGLWNENLKEELMIGNGSIQHIDSIPYHLKELYRTVWEIPKKSIIDMTADRAPYICKSKSLNLYVKNSTISKLTSIFYSWEKGLKTGMYYLRTKFAADAITLLTSQLKECLICSG